MNKVQLIEYKGYYLGVSNDAEIKEGDLVYENNLNQETKVYTIIKRDNELLFFRFRNVPIWLNKKQHGCKKIICASEELNLDVPVLPDWKEIEIEQLAINKIGYGINRFDNEDFDKVSWFKKGYNHNKNVYTEEDMRNAIQMAQIEEWDEGGYIGLEHEPDEIIKSINKHPKYIMIETEDCGTKDDGIIGIKTHHGDIDFNMEYRLKLTKLPNGKQSVIIKEILNNE